MTVTNIAVEVSSVASNQEEPDTRIVLHAIYAANNGSEKIVVRSPDTDVLVLLLHHRTEFILNISTLELEHRVNIPTYLAIYLSTFCLRNSAGSNITSCLSVYCRIGCATTISFRGSGKKAAFRILINKASHFQALTYLGSGPLPRAQ